MSPLLGPLDYDDRGKTYQRYPLTPAKIAPMSSRVRGRTKLATIAHQTRYSEPEEYGGQCDEAMRSRHTSSRTFASRRCWRHAGALVLKTGLPGGNSVRYVAAKRRSGCGQPLASAEARFQVVVAPGGVLIARAQDDSADR